MNSIYEKDYQDMIERLKRMRHECQMRQVDVAKKLKKPQSYVSKIEARHRKLDILELKQFLDVYQGKSSQIFDD